MTGSCPKHIAGCLRDPEVVVMDGVGHLPNLERPDDFNEHLLQFLGRLPVAWPHVARGELRAMARDV